MNSSTILLGLAFGIGIVAGLRALAGPAVISWMAHLEVIRLQGTRLSFMATAAAAAVFTLLAVLELVNDKLPKTPPRTEAAAFGARIVMGILAGCALAMAGRGPVPICAALGLAGAIAGTYGGYYARTNLVKALKCPDIPIALLEDVVAVGGAILLVSRI